MRELAPEFYDTIPSHPSWPMVIVNFIRDPEVGIFSRIKRLSKEARAETEAKHSQEKDAPEESTASFSDSDDAAGQKK